MSSPGLCEAPKPASDEGLGKQAVGTKGRLACWAAAGAGRGPEQCPGHRGTRKVGAGIPWRLGTEAQASVADAPCPPDFPAVDSGHDHTLQTSSLSSSLERPGYRQDFNSHLTERKLRHRMAGRLACLWHSQDEKSGQEAVLLPQVFGWRWLRDLRDIPASRWSVLHS